MVIFFQNLLFPGHTCKAAGLFKIAFFTKAFFFPSLSSVKPMAACRLPSLFHREMGLELLAASLFSKGPPTQLFPFFSKGSQHNSFPFFLKGSQHNSLTFFPKGPQHNSFPFFQRAPNTTLCLFFQRAPHTTPTSFFGTSW